MKKTEIKSVTRERTVVTGIVCDLCGHDVNDRSRWPEPLKGEHNRIETRVEHRIVEADEWDFLGSKYLDLDICPACWFAALLPMLREAGLRTPYAES